MSQIKRLTSDDIPALLDIVSNAFSPWNVSTPEQRAETIERWTKLQDEPKTTGLYGAWRDDQLAGGMWLREFTMNLHGVTVRGAGVGMLAVGLLHKKQKVARDIVVYFLRWARAEGMPVAMLYPFRPDFYRNMGFGWGTKDNRYQIAPAAFPRGSREHVRMLTSADAAAVHACYTRFYERTHGMFARDLEGFEKTLNDPKVRAVGVERDGMIYGYLLWTFENAHRDNDMTTDMHVSALLYEDGSALGELCAFLQAQSDQIDRVHIHSQDAFLHHLLTDPRNSTANFLHMAHESNAQGIGIMYRVVDVPAFFRALEGRSFGDQTCLVRFTMIDDLLPENNTSTTVRFVDGRPSVVSDEAYDVEIRLPCAHASSLLLGVVTIKHLLRYGLVEISDHAYVQTLHQLFAADEPPICMTYF